MGLLSHKVMAVYSLQVLPCAKAAGYNCYSGGNISEHNEMQVCLVAKPQMVRSASRSTHIVFILLSPAGKEKQSLHITSQGSGCGDAGRSRAGRREPELGCPMWNCDAFGIMTIPSSRRRLHTYRLNTPDNRIRKWSRRNRNPPFPPSLISRDRTTPPLPSCSAECLAKPTSHPQSMR